jgi:hypothetical protein
LRDEFRAGAGGPDADLLDRCGAEGVARGEHHLQAIGTVALRELADGGGLARAVHADHEDGEGLVRAIDDERLRDRGQHRRDVLAQRGEQRIDIAQLLAGHALTQTFDELFGDHHAAVRLQQPCLELLERRGVDLATTQDRAESGTQGLAAARERGAQALEETGRRVGGHPWILSASRQVTTQRSTAHIGYSERPAQVA